MHLLLLLACSGDPATTPPAAVGTPAPFVLRRLNRVEYQRTLTELLGAPVEVAAQLPPDDSAGGFDNAAAALATSPLHVELWEQAASAAAQQILFEPLQEPVEVTVEGEFGLVGDGNEWNGAYDWGGEAGYALWAGGMVSWLYEAPAGGAWRLSARVRADHAADDGAQVSLQVDGIVVHTAVIPREEPGWVTVTADVELAAGLRQVSLSYDNDIYDEALGYDRNVFLDWLRAEGPLDLVPEVNPARERVMICELAEGRPCAAAILDRFAARAWRRPLTDDDRARLLALYDEVLAAGDPPAWGLEIALRAVLLSPEFLFLAEAPATAAATEVGPHELATRLSYFLWSSMPDDALRARADDGSLLDPAVLVAEARRMLQDPRAVALTEDMAGQWLGMRMAAQATPDAWAYPLFNEVLRDSMVAEMETLFRTFVDQEELAGGERSLRELLTAEWAWLDGPLARFYGVPYNFTGGQHSFSLYSRHRGGWLGQAGLLMATSYPTRTSPVRRGVWVLSNLLCDEPEPPPPGVEGFPEPDGALTTVRERLEAHRANPGCAACHDDIDPIGLAFEHFDGVGAWRELDEDGEPVDATGELPGGDVVDGVQELSAALVDDPRFSRCLVEKVFSWAHHRVPLPQDEPFLEDIHRAFEAEDMTLRALVEAIVTSPTFRMRQQEVGP
jgi:hypothetical protein